jgi:peptidoglycan-associated lipoprotein
VLLLTGCPKRLVTSDISAPAPSKTQPSAAFETQQSAAATPGSPSGSSPSSPSSSSTAMPRPSELAANDNLKDIHFDLDRYDIQPGDARILGANATWLKAHRDDLMLIKGHCDERGTNEYNLALGERRAKATMSYLAGRGVKVSRITLMSYSRERPICIEHNEACWARNRRAHFLVKNKCQICLDEGSDLVHELEMARALIPRPRPACPAQLCATPRCLLRSPPAQA